MTKIEESELIINSRGAVYHLNLTPHELADTIITVGDPDRVHEVSKYFDRIEIQQQHREFVTHTGFVGNKRISCVSTGIGPDNIDIVINELDALANIDFDTRTVKTELKQLKIVRVGTSGSLQSNIPVDSFVVSTHGLGIDNLMHFYNQQNTTEDIQILEHFIAHTQIHNHLSTPYINGCSSHLLKEFVQGYHHGITVTCPGFYGPQGRVLRLGLSNPTFVDLLTGFSFGNHSITNFEMETSAIYGLGKLLNHHCLSISAIVANRVKKEFSNNAAKAVDTLIQQVVQTLATI